MSDVIKKKMLIGIPHTGNLRPELALWLFNVAKNNVDVDVFFRYQQPVSINRNEIVHYFLKHEAMYDWLLFIDSDQLPKTNLVLMCDHGERVVSGLTSVMHKGVPMPLIMKRAVEVKDAVMYRMISMSDVQESLTSKGLIEVDGVGTGVLLVHRSVFEEMPTPWFEFEVCADGTLFLSEDYSFSNKLSKMGVKMFVDINARAGHAKNIDLFELNSMMGHVIQNIKKVKVDAVLPVINSDTNKLKEVDE